MASWEQAAFQGNFIQENSEWSSQWYHIDESPPEDSFPTPRRGRRQQCTVRKVQQRQAANMRERRRMKTINEAFDRLRTSIPISDDDRKLSKVDTLRLAIRYIQRLRDIVKVPVEDPDQIQGQNDAVSADYNKVIITYPSQESVQAPTENSSHLIGHSLSWQTQEMSSHDRKLSAKVWMPSSDHALYVGDL